MWAHWAGARAAKAGPRHCIEFLIERDDLAGPINLASPGPQPQREFMRTLRTAAGIRVGLPATRLMVTIGAVILRTDTELILKRRRVVSRRLLEAGFTFRYPEWMAAAEDLVHSTRGA